MSRKPVGRWLTATYCFIQQQERHSQNEPSVLYTSLYCGLVSLSPQFDCGRAGSWRRHPLTTNTCPLVVLSDHSSRCHGGQPPRTNPPPPFLLFSHKGVGIHLHDRVAGSDLDHSKQPVQECTAQLMQDTSPNTAYKNVGDWFSWACQSWWRPGIARQVSRRTVILS